MSDQDDTLKGNAGDDLPNRENADPSSYKRFQRGDHDQPTTLPGIHRYQSFSNLKHRTPSENLNRLSMLAIAGSLGLVIAKPVFHGNLQTIYCYECRACYATQDNCPASIQYQAELTISARAADYAKFIRTGGLNCIRCGLSGILRPASRHGHNIRDHAERDDEGYFPGEGTGQSSGGSPPAWHDQPGIHR
jgi:hypothetical protein